MISQDANAWVGLDRCEQCPLDLATGGVLGVGDSSCGVTPVSYTHLDVYKRQVHTLRVNRWESLDQKVRGQMGHIQRDVVGTRAL